MLQEIFHFILELLIYILNTLSILVIVWGAVLQFANFLKVEFSKSRVRDKSESMKDVVLTKNYLGIYILFGLELLIGSDIIASISDPSFRHIATLAVIVFVRTVISYFLSREINSLSDE